MCMLCAFLNLFLTYCNRLIIREMNVYKLAHINTFWITTTPNRQKEDGVFCDESKKSSGIKLSY